MASDPGHDKRPAHDAYRPAQRELEYEVDTETGGIGQTGPHVGF